MRWLTALAVIAAGCSFKVPSGAVNLRLEIPRERAPAGQMLWRPELEKLIPTTIGGMDCFFLNVNGPGIEADETASGRELSFLDLGVTSGLAAAGDGVVSMRVPAGLARTIQVLGIAGSPPLTNCAGRDVKDVLITERPSLFEIGRTTSSLYQDATVTVSNAYQAAYAYDLMSAYEGTLLLNQGYEGSAPLGTINALSGGLPPSGMSDVKDDAALATDFAELQNPALSDAGLAYRLPPPGAGNLFARLDFAFAIGTASLSRYSSFQVDGIVGGGTSAFAGICSAAIGANGGVEVAVYNARLQSWSAPTASLTTAPSALAPLLLPLSSDYLETSGGQTFIHVTVFSTDAASAVGTTCSNLLVDQLKITLVP
jgi:hypothetical protein